MPIGRGLAWQGGYWLNHVEDWPEKCLETLKGCTGQVVGAGEGRTIVAENDDHPSRLIRLLTIGLRVLTLLEFTVLRCLAAENERTTAYGMRNITE